MGPRGKLMKHLDHYLNETIQNIRDDREVTRELLDDVLRVISKSEENHGQVGTIAAKYVETLQRSNEQIVKIAALMSKNEKSDGLSERDMEDIYSMIREEDKE